MTSDGGEKKLERFGRYLILDHLVDGGMAKICRARFLGEQADKIVAIKMIQPQYSLDPSFKKMFMDEIKVTFGLIHPNIAQTYDYGIINGQLYTAIEYVDGKNLKQFLDRLKDRKFVFPVEISTFITSQICQGLTYAHNFNDKLTGKILNIIHRDISPHNIMITYDGAVKIIDFGIAKAETNSEETKAGTIKGKLSYLAPEYLEGMDLDHRYDQFAVGITLWELLCSRKLFNAANELATLKKIQECKIPEPSSINPNVPKELDQIVLKSLSKDRKNRFQNMDQFNRALVKFLYSNYPDFNATDLNYFAKELFKDDIKEDREKFQLYGKIDIAPYLLELKNELEGNVPSAPPVPAPGATAPAKGATETTAAEAAPSGPPKITVLEFGLDEEEKDDSSAPKKLSLALDNTVSRKVHGMGPKGGKSAAAGTKAARQDATSSGTKNPLLKAKEAAPAVRYAKDAGSEGKGSSNSQDQVVKKSGGGLIKVVGLAGILAVLYFNKGSLMGIKESGKKATKEGSSRIPSSVSNGKGQAAADKAASEKAGPMVKVNFSNSNLYQRFFVNDKEVKYNITGIDLPVDQTYKIRVEEKNKRPIFMTIKVTEDGPTSFRLPDTTPGSFGILRSASDYVDGSTLTITIDGHEVVYELPLPDTKVPVGKYRGQVLNPVTGAIKEIPFEILEDAVTKLPK